jgi:hypothetical protein
VLAFAAALWLRPVATPGPALRDFEAYYAAGAAWNAGDDPYSRQIWRGERTIPGVTASRDELLPFVGPPFSLPLWGAFARLDYAQAALLWSTLLALSFALLSAGTLRLVAPQAGASAYLAALALGAGFGPLTSGLALGQVAVFACAAAVAAQVALARSNALAAATAALGAALQPNLGISLVARLPTRRAAIALALAGAVAVGCSAAALGGLDGLWHYVEGLRDHARAETGIAIQTTVAAVASAFGASSVAAQAIATATALLAAGALLALFATRRYGGLERFALTSATLPIVLPFAHEHDFTLAFFPALVCALRCSGGTWIAAACTTLFVAVDWLGLAQRPSGLPQSLCLATTAAFALAALGPRELGLRRLWPLAVVPLVALAGAFAAMHPLPIWPDALPHGFHADKTLSVAAVWRLEQIATGLGKPDAVWGALRACSLLGCVGLAAAAARGLRTP